MPFGLPIRGALKSAFKMPILVAVDVEAEVVAACRGARGEW
jgi:hypothetical protein